MKSLLLMIVIIALSISAEAEVLDWELMHNIEGTDLSATFNADIQKYGIVTKEGEVISELIYSDIGRKCGSGLIAVYDYDDNEKQNYTAYCDTQGNIVIPFFMGTGFDFCDGYARVVEKKQRTRFIDPNGSDAWGREEVFDEAGDFSEGFAWVRSEKSYYYINTNGDKATNNNTYYEEAASYANGMACVKTDGKWGCIDESGELVVPAQYEYVLGFDEHGLSVVFLENGNSGVIDKTGKLLFSKKVNMDIYIKDENTFIVDTQYYVKQGDEYVLVPEVSSSFDISGYFPNESDKLATLESDVTLAHIPDKTKGLPRVDGATALFPMYSAMVQAVYPASTRYEYANENTDALITCSKTNGAYDRLVNGNADIIFCAGPSDDQIRSAKEKGVEFELTPIAKEAFVFFVNPDNPIENISLDDIRRIYSGTLTDWSDLGINDMGEIIAYQRPENSGSQTALQRLMEGYALMPAPEDYVAWDMGSIVDVVEYRNFPNAIGYSFRFYVTGLMQANVKLLSLNGVAPTKENITSGVYPQTTQIYAVTRKGDNNPNLAAFLDWVCSEQGMELVEKSGYVPEY